MDKSRLGRNNKNNKHKPSRTSFPTMSSTSSIAAKQNVNSRLEWSCNLDVNVTHKTNRKTAIICTIGMFR